MLHGSQIAESYGSPPKPFDILPSGLIPPPLPKRPAGGPLRVIALVQLVKVVIFRGKKSVGITRNGSTMLLYHDDR